MKDCRINSDDDRKRLLEEMRVSKKARFSKDKKVAAVSLLSGEAGDSSIFSTSFCGDAVQAFTLTDQGSDENIIPASGFKEILHADNTDL